MKKNVWLLPLLSASLVLGACADADKADSTDLSTPIVTLDGKDITNQDVYDELKDSYGGNAVRQLAFQHMLEKHYTVSDKELDASLSRFMEAQNLPDEKALTDFLAQSATTRESFDRYIRHNTLLYKAVTEGITVSEQEISGSFESIKDDIRASHILVKDEKTAQELLDQLGKGASFEELAKTHSTDPGSAAKGGDLGFFGKGIMDPAFESAAFALKKGEVSGIVKSSFGFHLIKVTAIGRTLEEERASLKDQLMQTKARSQDEVFAELLTKTKISVHDQTFNSLFSPPAPAQ